MKTIVSFFKSIWNFFFKKKITIDSQFEKRADVIVQSKIIEQKIAKPQTQLFRNQQLPGKTYNIGKSRFRIKKKLGLTASEKLRYEIIQL